MSDVIEEGFSNYWELDPKDRGTYADLRGGGQVVVQKAKPSRPKGMAEQMQMKRGTTAKSHVARRQAMRCGQLA